MRRLAVTLCAVIVVGCGSTTTTSDPPATPTEPVATPPITVPSAPVQSATEPASTPKIPSSTAAVPSTTAAVNPTTSTNTSLPLPIEVTTFGPPPELLESSPPSDLDWGEVGDGWLALDVGDHYHHPPTALDVRGLYLRAPDGHLYAIAALPADGTDVMSISIAGRRALLKGPYDEGLPIGGLDLETTEYRQVIAESHELEIVTFTSGADGLWIYDLIPTSGADYVGTVRVNSVDLGDHSWATIFEESFDAERGNRFYSWWVNNRGGILELASGDLVITTPTGILIGPAGGPFEPLDTPDVPCSVAGLWSDDQVLVRCLIDVETTEYWGDATGLRLVPTDGRPSSVLAMPADSAWDTRYRYAVPFAGGLAIQAMFGDGECTQEVLFVTDDGTRHWEPPVEEPCDEHIVAGGNGTLLLVSRIPAWDIESFFLVTATDTTSVELPDARIITLTSSRSERTSGSPYHRSTGQLHGPAAPAMRRSMQRSIRPGTPVTTKGHP